MARTSRQETEELTRSAIDAIEAGEDPGEMSVATALGALRHYLHPLRLGRHGVGLAGELLKVLAGRSEIAYERGDWRFKDPTWHENPAYRRLGQGYLAACRALQQIVDDEGVHWRDRERAKFAVEILTSTLAPTNFLLGNPAALKRLLETGGGSLVKGLRNFVHDLRFNRGMPTQVDASGFEVGRNLAATPGAVVFRNELLEILQFTVASKSPYAIPVLIVTPQINKYYFLDLAPGKSFVEYLASQGIQPFIVSWKNPTAAEGDWNTDRYVDALVEAVAAVRSIAGVPRINLFGFCAGGIMTTALLAHLKHTRRNWVNAISFAVTLLDFSRPAMIGLLHSKPLLSTARSRSRKQGIIAGRDLATVFTWFRPNDLVWNYWVNNYLLGNSPPSFDILAWNADSTNLPAALHCEFLDIFERNPLVTAGEFEVHGKPLDLGQFRYDAFVTGGITDHLTPWTGCYQTTQLLGGNVEFVLSNAGHIASLVNPPGNPKASYYTGPKPGADPEAWRAAATHHQGSWWEYWVQWASKRSGPKRQGARTLGSRQYPALEDAPGTYIYG